MKTQIWAINEADSGPELQASFVVIVEQFTKLSLALNFKTRFGAINDTIFESGLRVELYNIESISKAELNHKSRMLSKRLCLKFKSFEST